MSNSIYFVSCRLDIARLGNTKMKEASLSCYENRHIGWLASKICRFAKPLENRSVRESVGSSKFSVGSLNFRSVRRMFAGCFFNTYKIKSLHGRSPHIIWHKTYTKHNQFRFTCLRCLHKNGMICQRSSFAMVYVYVFISQYHILCSCICVFYAVPMQKRLKSACAGKQPMVIRSASLPLILSLSSSLAPQIQHFWA